MRTFTYLITFVIVAVSAVIYTAHYALLYSKVHLLGMLPGGGIPVLIFGRLPFPTQPDPSPYVAIACSAPLLILAFRRLFLLARTGSFTPPEFRGFTYVVALVGLTLILVAASVYVVTRSAMLGLLALSPASWALLLSFVLAELAGLIKGRPVLKPAAIAVGVIALASMFLPWDAYVAKLAYERLCASRSGEKVYATVPASSYLLIGEAPGDDSFRVQTAVDDVLDKKVEFVEVQRLPHNTTQRNSLDDYFNYRVPDTKFFRISLATDGSPGCLPADRSPIRRANAKGRIKDGECLQFYPIEAPRSRYKIEVEADAKPLWYTWRVFMQRVSASDRQSGELLGESTIFQRVSGAALSDRERAELECPTRQARRPLTQLHRRVLLGTP